MVRIHPPLPGQEQLGRQNSRPSCFCFHLHNSADQNARHQRAQRQRPWQHRQGREERKVDWLSVRTSPVPMAAEQRTGFGMVRTRREICNVAGDDGMLGRMIRWFRVWVVLGPL